MADEEVSSGCPDVDECTDVGGDAKLEVDLGASGMDLGHFGSTRLFALSISL